MTLDRLLHNAITLDAALSGGDLLRRVLEPREDLIMSYQRQQLFEGKGSDGQDLRPYYTEDLAPGGYFKTKAQAEAYKVRKLNMRYPYQAHDRNPEAPNLFINGKFHSEIGLYLTSSVIAIGPDTPYASEIVQKYGLERFGLTQEHWEAVMGEALPDIMQSVKETIYA